MLGLCCGEWATRRMEMTFLIEKNIPFGVSGIVKERPPIREMEVGDSVLVEAKNAGAAAIKFASNAMQMEAPFRNYKFKSLPEGDKFRVWRIV